MMYDEKERYGLSLAHCIVNATPKQCMGYYADRRNASSFNDEVDIVATSYTTALELLLIKSPVPTVSDREALFRTCFFRETDRTETDSYFKVGYTMEDERRPAKKGRVREGGEERGGGRAEGTGSNPLPIPRDPATPLCSSARSWSPQTACTQSLARGSNTNGYK